jgi:hypothetical protein
MPVSEDPSTLAPVLDERFAAHCSRLRTDDPWFGRVVLDRGGKPSEYLIGSYRHPDERIIDWRHPIAAAYYERRPGEEFELDVTGLAALSGTVASRAAIGHAGRRIRKIEFSTTSGRCVSKELSPKTSRHGFGDRRDA